MDKSNAQEHLLWWLAWRPRAAAVGGGILGVLLFAASGSGVLGLFGVAIAISLWVWSTSSVNNAWAGIIDRQRQEVEAQGRRLLQLGDKEVVAFTLVNESGNGSLRLEPSRRYTFNCVFITPVLIGIYDGARYDAVNQALYLGSKTKEIYFKQVVGVDYHPPTIEIKTIVGGDPLTLCGDSAETAHAIVGEIRNRLRAVHA
jgi:hypothetical protein